MFDVWLKKTIHKINLKCYLNVSLHKSISLNSLNIGEMWKKNTTYQGIWSSIFVIKESNELDGILETKFWDILLHI